MKVLFYDGDCGVCNTFVQFVLENGNDDSLKFCQIQSTKGGEILTSLGISNIDVTTAYYWDGHDCYSKSQAILEVMRKVRYPYRMLSVLRLFPRSLTDVGYVLFSKNRQFFSKLMFRKKVCSLISTRSSSRFLS